MAPLPVNLDPRWVLLRSATPARIGLKRAGSTIATSERLAFQLAHAEARDAVIEKFDAESIINGLKSRGLEPILLHTAASDRHTYLARPELGRRLDVPSNSRLADLTPGYDLMFVIADGLSQRAVTRHALPLLDRVIPELVHKSWKIGPVAVVGEGRVAIGDEIGAVLKAGLVAVLIGERPGLTAPDSLGIYLTWKPAVGRTDAERNCLSNIRPEGMTYDEAAQRLLFLCTEARRRQCTGIKLKDDTVLIAPANVQSLLKP